MTGVVLMYHRVTRSAIDPYGIAVTPEHFAEHVEVLERTGSVVPLAEVRGPGLRVAVTFDDGYADNAVAAAPLLEQAALPATFFVTTGTLGGACFWWDRLTHALVSGHPLPDGVDVELGGRRLWLDLHDHEARDRSLRFVHRRLRALPPDDLTAAVDDLLARLGAPPPLTDAATMTREQLHELAGRPGMEIGAHTRTHAQLALQPEAVQRDEVLGSVEDLRRELGRPVTSFAYPFGSPQAVGPVAVRLAAESGCAIACSTDRAPVTASSPAHRLPRLNVRDWSGAELQAQVATLATR